MIGFDGVRAIRTVDFGGSGEANAVAEKRAKMPVASNDFALVIGFPF